MKMIKTKETCGNRSLPSNMDGSATTTCFYFSNFPANLQERGQGAWEIKAGFLRVYSYPIFFPLRHPSDIAALSLIRVSTLP